MQGFQTRNGLTRLLYGLLLVVGPGCWVGCRVQSPQGIMEPDFYRILQKTQPGLKGRDVYVVDSGDSLELVFPQTDHRRVVRSPDYKTWTFRRTEVDVDVFTIPFKIRPARAHLPAQLNSNFNAALYVGRRTDLYNYRWKTVSPSFAVRQLQSRGFGYGLFAGIGSTSISDFVLRRPIGVEYEGVVLDAGVAAIYDARVFNVGIALGVDHLLDVNRRNWIYQQRPWFGVLFGLNLN
ncbi:hypothetical protein GCM10027347_05400 [Larkinella harenae]